MDLYCLRKNAFLVWHGLLVGRGSVQNHSTSRQCHTSVKSHSEQETLRLPFGARYRSGVPPLCQPSPGLRRHPNFTAHTAAARAYELSGPADSRFRPVPTNLCIADDQSLRVLGAFWRTVGVSPPVQPMLGLSASMLFGTGGGQPAVDAHPPFAFGYGRRPHHPPIFAIDRSGQ
jgi:hypothetical protein